MAWGDDSLLRRCLLKQPLCLLEPYFPGSVWTLPADGSRAHISFAFTLLLHLILAYLFFIFFSFDCLYLDPWVFSSYFFPVSCWGGGWESSWVCLWHPGKVSPQHQWWYIWSQMTEWLFVIFSDEWLGTVFVQKDNLQFFKIKTNVWGREFFHPVFSGASLSL